MVARVLWFGSGSIIYEYDSQSNELHMAKPQPRSLACAARASDGIAATTRRLDYLLAVWR